jgi:RNA polymerase sigma factor (sigma-70 family)
LVQHEHVAAQATAPPLRLDTGLPLAPEGFEAFWQVAFRDLVRVAMIYGATFQEAEDAAAQTLLYMLRRWPIPGNPLAYARRAVISNFIKGRKHGSLQAASRLIEHGHVPRHEGEEDARLAVLEDAEWLTQVLSHLTPAQREVMERVVDGLSYEEIANAIGKSAEVVRRRVCDARARLIRLLSPDGEYRQIQTGKANTSREEAR